MMASSDPDSTTTMNYELLLLKEDNTGKSIPNFKIYIYIYFFKGWIRLPAEILYTHSAYIHNLLQQDDQVRTITIPGSLPIRGLLKLKEFYTAG